MPSFMCLCSQPSTRWAASLRNLIVTNREGEKNPNELEKKKTWKLLQILEVLSITYAMMVNTVALFALHV